MLTLNLFDTLFRCFYCCLWPNKCRLRWGFLGLRHKHGFSSTSNCYSSLPQLWILLMLPIWYKSNHPARSSLPETFCKRRVLKNFAKLLENICGIFFFQNKVAVWGSEKETGTGIFLRILWNFNWTLFNENLQWLHLPRVLCKRCISKNVAKSTKIG